ncbi:hypothetical protein [Nesterenkonia populi]
MDSSNIVNLGLLAVTAVGVLVAIYQAKEARAARNDAQDARDDAQAHEKAALAASQESASAAGRSAVALEEANEIARQTLPRDPWKLIQHTKNKYELRNDSPNTLWAVSVIQADGGNDITPFEDMPIDQLHPGTSIYLDYSKSFASPATATIMVSWGFPDSTEQKTWRRTLG